MPHPLITANELNAALRDIKVFDLRWSVTDPGHGRVAYRGGHIPGAVFVDLDRDLAAPTGPGRHPLPTLSRFETTMGALGLTADDAVVVYDDTSGTIAARLWWMLHAVGHRDVKLLDGGWRAWLGRDLPVEEAEVTPQPAHYGARHDFIGMVDRGGLAGRQVVDVRAPERYTGAFEPIDPKSGHIPGAVNIPTAASLDADGTFKMPEKLTMLFDGLEHPVVSCGSGVNACHTALAMILAGLDMPEVYIGSFSDWSSSDLPVNTGIVP